MPLKRKKPRAGPGGQGTEEDRRRMKLAMVMTSYSITYYTRVKKEGFQLPQLK